MNRLDELIQKLCPNGVNYQNLGSFCQIQTGKGITNNDTSENGLYPVISGGVEPMGFYDKYNRSPHTVTVSRAGSAGYVNYIDTYFYLNDKCFSVIPTNDVNSRYLFHVLKSKEEEIIGMRSTGAVPTVNTKKVSSVMVPLPPLEVQSEIVRILDSFTELTAELTAELIAELTAREKQYKYYCDTLLERHMPAERVTLGSVCEVYDGTHQTPEYTESGVPFVSVEDIDNLHATRKFISEEAFAKFKIKPRTGDVFMTRITAGIIGKCAVVDSDDDLAYYVSLALLRPNHSVLNSKYLKHYLESGIGRAELAKRILWNATPTKINKVDIGKLFIAVPPLDVQERIVCILDKADDMWTGLARGLPTEIEARQKQYEYYRDKLLTFTPAE